MAKPTHFPTVEAWTNSLFKSQSSDAKSLNEQTLSNTGKILLEVHPNSPAGLLGLKSGDILYALNGGIFDIDDLEKTFQSRKFGRSHSFDFLRPSERKKIRVKGPTFPFGARFGQTKESFIVELRNGSPDPSDTYQFWNAGDAQALAEILPALEAFNIRIISLNGSPFDGPLPQALPSNTELANENDIWTGHFTWLALCAAHAGQWERARFVLKWVEDHFERSGDGGMRSMFAAMSYTRSMLAEQNEQREIAVDHMHHAIEMSPETDVLYQRLSSLTNAEAKPATSPFVGQRISYNLSKHDPSQRYKQSEGHVGLEDCIANLSPGEFILVCVMSSYRTNGPYVEGFKRAQMPLAKLKNIFREIHVITSWDKADSRDLPWPIMEEKMRKTGINVSVLFDPEQSLSEQLPLTSSPTNLIIDHRGIIVADGWLGGDAILWDALAKH